MRFVYPFPVLLLVTLSACVKLQQERIGFDRISGCPATTAVVLLAHQSELGPLSTTHALECALDFLRNTRDPILLRSALGSRVSLHLAERDPDPVRRERLTAEGVRFAEQALAVGGDGVAHYYLAANLGLAVRDQISLAVQNLPRLEDEMKRALVLNPDVDDGGPLRLLGMLYLKAPPWPIGIGDGDKALDLLKQAVDRHPGHPLNRLFYAQALWEVEGNEAADQIRSQLAAGMKLLRDGNWGYNEEPWGKEFIRIRKEIDGIGIIGRAFRFQADIPGELMTPTFR